MARRRYRSRRGRRRGRTTKRRGITANRINKLINGTRKVILEDTGGLSFDANVITYQVLHCLGCYVDIGNISNALGVGDAEMFDYETKLIPQRIIKWKTMFHYRNVSTHACFFTIYECEYRDDAVTDGSGVTSSRWPILNLAQGWDTFTATAAVDAIGTGTMVDYTANSQVCKSKLKSLTPYNSQLFCQKFKILKKVAVRLNMGDDFVYTLKHPAYTYNYEDWINTHPLKNTVLPIYAKKGTKFLLYATHGALGKSIADDTVTGYLAGDIAWESMETCEVYPLVQQSKSIGIDNSRDAPADLEGPTEMVMLADDP